MSTTHSNSPALDAVVVPKMQESVLVKCVLGAIANTAATAVTNPIDVVKVRLQLQTVATPDAAAAAAATETRYLGFGHGLKVLWQEEGFRGLMKGWEASFLRESLYSGIRFGCYDIVKETLEDKVMNRPKEERKTTPLLLKLTAGAITGGVGSAIMNPMDLVKTRMQADRTGARYHNSFWLACKDITKSEGLIKGFYRGVGATTSRAMVLTAAQLPCYDQAKEVLLKHTSLEEGFTVHFSASMFAGLCAATASSPMDVMKTIIQTESSAGGPQKNVMAKCFMKVLRQDGVRGFFKGWLPNWLRLGPHTVISLIAYEQLRDAMGISPL